MLPAQMLQLAETTDYHTLLSTKKGVQVVTKWFLHLGLLNQFSLAREMDQEDMEVHQENYQENQDLGQEDQHQGMGERES